VFRKGCTCVAAAGEGVDEPAESLDAAGWDVFTVVEKCLELGTRERGPVAPVDGWAVWDAAEAVDCVAVAVDVCELLARKRDAEWLEK